MAHTPTQHAVGRAMAPAVQAERNQDLLFAQASSGDGAQTPLPTWIDDVRNALPHGDPPPWPAAKPSADVENLFLGAAPPPRRAQGGAADLGAYIRGQSEIRKALPRRASPPWPAAKLSADVGNLRIAAPPPRRAHGEVVDLGAYIRTNKTPSGLARGTKSIF